ncbi:MAG: phosphatase [Sulfuricurvum sp.]
MIAIDLGSNTLRMVEYDGKTWGKTFEKIVRTAQGLDHTRRIDPRAIERIVLAIEEAKTLLNFEGQTIVAVTTAAMRMAHNSHEVREVFRQRTGIHFRVITGEEEAKLTLMAVQHRLNALGITSPSWALVDIGGGSTEIIVVTGEKIDAKSLPFGIVTMSESGDSKGRLTLFREALLEALPENIPKTLVLTAGTPTTMAAYLHGMTYATYDPHRINGTTLKASDCGEILDALRAMDESTRATYVGVGREQLIITGIAMVESVFHALGCDEAVVVDDGLREGVALNHVKLALSRSQAPAWECIG